MAEELEGLGGGGAAAGRLRAVCRLRPAWPPAASPAVAAAGAGGRVVVRDPRAPAGAPAGQAARTYEVSAALGEHTSEGELWEALGAPALDWWLGGFSALVLALGQAGAGKTHSLFGGAGAGAGGGRGGGGEGPGAGLFGRLVGELFRALGEALRSGEARLALSCWEVVGHEAVDLLPAGGAPLRGAPAGGSAAFGPLGGFEAYEVGSPFDVAQLLEAARGRSVNWGARGGLRVPLPNRGHGFVRLALWRAEARQAAVLHFVDLAGAQPRGARAGGAPRPDPLSQSDRERRLVNQQLLALSRIVTEVAARAQDAAAGAAVLSARDSKLTQLVAPLLAGNARTFLLAAVSPRAEDYLDTLQTLRVAHRAMAITTACMKVTNVPEADFRPRPLDEGLSAEQAVRAAAAADAPVGPPAGPQGGAGPAAPPMTPRNYEERHTASTSAARAAAGAAGAVGAAAPTRGPDRSERREALVEELLGGPPGSLLGGRGGLRPSAVAALGTASPTREGGGLSPYGAGGEEAAGEYRGADAPSPGAGGPEDAEALWGGRLSKLKQEFQQIEAEMTDGGGALPTRSPAPEGAAAEPGPVPQGQPQRASSGQGGGAAAAPRGGGVKEEADRAPPPRSPARHPPPTPSRIDDFLVAGRAEGGGLSASAADISGSERWASHGGAPPADVSIPHPIEAFGETVLGVREEVERGWVRQRLGEAQHREEDLQKRYDSTLTALRNERLRCRKLEQKVSHVEQNVVEVSAAYEVQLNHHKLQEANLRAKCRQLESESSFANVFDKYEQEIGSLEKDVALLKEDNQRLVARMAAAEEHSGGHPEEEPPVGPEDRKVAALRKSLRKMRAERDSLQSELLEYKKKDRKYALHKKSSEETIRKINAMQRAMAAKEEEVIQRNLEAAAADGKVVTMRAATRELSRENEHLTALVSQLRKEQAALKERVMLMRRSATKDYILERLPHFQGSAKTAKPTLGNTMVDLTRRLQRIDGHPPKAEYLLDRLLHEVTLCAAERNILLKREASLLAMLTGEQVPQHS